MLTSAAAIPQLRNGVQRVGDRLARHEAVHHIPGDRQPLGGAPQPVRPAGRQNRRARDPVEDAMSACAKSRLHVAITSSSHVRVVVVGGRDERLLDRPGRRPPQQVQRRTGLVVGARRAGTAERLLADDGAGGLVVDVEVARREAQPVLGLQHRVAIVGDHRAGQRILRAGVDDVEHLLVVRIGIDVHRQDRPEVFGGERLVAGVVGQQHRRPNEIAFAVVVFAAGGDRDTGSTLGAFDGLDVLGECAVVDERAAEVGQIGDVAVAQRLGGAEEVVAHLLPHRPRNERPRRGRALLPLVVERAADQRGAQHVGPRRRMSQHEVLAAGLTDQPRIGVVAVDVRADLAPQVLERRRWSR